MNTTESVLEYTTRVAELVSANTVPQPEPMQVVLPKYTNVQASLRLRDTAYETLATLNGITIDQFARFSVNVLTPIYHKCENNLMDLTHDPRAYVDLITHAIDLRRLVRRKMIAARRRIDAGHSKRIAILVRERANMMDHISDIKWAVENDLPRPSYVPSWPSLVDDNAKHHAYSASVENPTTVELFILDALRQLETSTA